MFPVAATPSDLTTLPALAAQLRLPREWLRAQAQAGLLPYLRVGRRMLFSRQAVMTALARLAAGRGVAHE
jgi:excisionase family DNA binding protein